MDRVRRACRLAGPLLLGVLLLAPALSAESPGSLGVTPAKLAIEAAQRGESYRVQVAVQNQFDSPTEVLVEVLDEGDGWEIVTEPAGSFSLPPYSETLVDITLEVPVDAPNGLHAKHVRFSAGSKETPTGTGFALRYAVTVPINVTVGGAQVMKLDWGAPRVENIEVGTPPVMGVLVSNHGNVRAVAHARAEILDFSGERDIARATGQLGLIPGDSGELRFAFEDALPQGQYQVRIRSEPPGELDETVEFKVLPPGSLSKDGLLRYLEHEPRGDPGDPVKVSAVFENTGAALLGRAKFKGEIYLGERLVGVLESDERVVPVGETVRLDVYFTPKDPGVHRIVGVVYYDGFETLPNEGLLTVRETSPGSGKTPGPGAVAALVVLGLAARAWRRT